MSVLTKNKTPDTRPRCEAIAVYSGKRCAFRGIQYVGGVCVCRRHSGVGK